MAKNTTEVVIRPSWRSQWKWVVAFLLSCLLSVYVTRLLPLTLIHGELFRVGAERYMLDLPLLWFLPAFTLLKPLYNIYNVAYLFFGRGIEAKDGIISLNQKITRIRYEDVRVVEVQQTILGRLLGYGNVEVGTAATQSVEVSLFGVSRPRMIQDVILTERERVRKSQIENTEVGVEDDEAVITEEQEAV